MLNVETLTRRFPRLFLAIALTLPSLWFLSAYHARREYQPHTFETSSSLSHAQPHSQDAHEFWNLYSTVLVNAQPSFPWLNLTRSLGWLVYDVNKPHEREDVLDLSDEHFEELKLLHNVLVQDIKNIAARVPLNRGTRGIVTAANNDALTVLTTSLRMLRLAGSKLPVEIFINECEKVPCENIFPALGAKCVFMKDIVPEKMDYPISLNHFGYKAASVAFSSFEQVLYLDSDLFPVENPDELFGEEPFSSTGLVLWPDYWSSTTAPRYYEIANVSMPNMSTRASTESGAFLLDKATHAEAVLLAFYYNQYGDTHFYSLLSQGANGYGDKETWLAAAQVFDLPFYQVYEPPTRLGYRCGLSQHVVASAQYYPRDDWVNIQHGVRRGLKALLSDAPEPRIMFVHGNLPKYDVAYVMDWYAPNLDWTDMLRCDNNTGKPHRLWGPKDFTVRKFGWDVEKSVWDSMRWTACEHEGDYVMWWNGTGRSPPQKDLCKKIVSWYGELMPDETYTADLTPPRRLWPT